MNIIKKRSSLTDIESKLVLASGERRRDRIEVVEWEVQSTGRRACSGVYCITDYNQYFVITVNGK